MTSGKQSWSDRRNAAAELLCREVRWQIANNKPDETRLYFFLVKWMKVAKKNKYKRP